MYARETDKYLPDATLLYYKRQFSYMFRLVLNHPQAPTLYFPTNAHNIKKVELLKHFKIRKLPNMFRFTSKPSSGSHSQYLAKITYLVQSGYVDGR